MISPNHHVDLSLGARGLSIYHITAVGTIPFTTSYPQWVISAATLEFKLLKERPLSDNTSFESKYFKIYHKH